VGKADDVTERLLLGFLARSSGWTVAIVALLLYPGFGLALPLVLGLSGVDFVVVNVAGTVLAAVVSLGWLVTRVEAANRRHLVEWTTNLRLLDATEFEWLVGELFRREGWSVQETGGHGVGDGNIDLVLSRDGERRIVQCKRWTSWQVGVDEVRQLAGALLREGLPGSAGILVTLSDFTEAARIEASKTGLKLIERDELYTRVQSARHPEECDICHQPMVLDHSQHGWWFRCTTSGCKGKRDLGPEPGRAVEFLTVPRNA
jgi:restriction system protein